MSEKLVIGIWACDYFTRAFGYNDKLPWSGIKEDLEILDFYISRSNNIVASKSLYSTLPKSFKEKWPGMILCDSKNPIKKLLNKLNGTTIVLGGRSVFNMCINEALFDVIIENNLGFRDRRILNFTHVAPTIKASKYILVNSPRIIGEQAIIKQNIWEKR